MQQFSEISSVKNWLQTSFPGWTHICNACSTRAASLVEFLWSQVLSWSLELHHDLSFQTFLLIWPCHANFEIENWIISFLLLNFLNLLWVVIVRFFCIEELPYPLLLEKCILRPIIEIMCACTYVLYRGSSYLYTSQFICMLTLPLVNPWTSAGHLQVSSLKFPRHPILPRLFKFNAWISEFLIF
jgi:hypothetical protein